MVLQVDGLGGQASLTTPPAAITTTEAIAFRYQVPANEMQIGTHYRIVAHGTLTAGASGSVLARLRAGVNGTTADTQAAATTAAGTATSAGWRAVFDFTVRTTGSGGTAIGNGIVLIGTTMNITSQSATIAVNTAVANWISLTLTGGGTTPSITVQNATIEIVKP